jgi:hypothetical protein
MTSYEIVITIVQFLTLLALIGTLQLARNEYRTRTRPYIGFEEVRMKESQRADEIEFEVNVRNVGQLPAKNAKLYGEIAVEGEENTSFECGTKGSVFPSPEQIPIWIVGIKEADRDAIVKGAKNLRLSMTVDYYGTGNKKYKTYSSRMYDASRQSWIREEGNWD